MSPQELNYATPNTASLAGRRRTIAAFALALASLACDGIFALGERGPVISLLPQLIVALVGLALGAGGFVVSILAWRASATRLLPLLALLLSGIGVANGLACAAVTALFLGYHGC